MGVKKEGLDSDSSPQPYPLIPVPRFASVKALYPNQSEIDTKDTTGAYRYDRDDGPSLRSAKEIKKTPTEKTSLR